MSGTPERPAGERDLDRLLATMNPVLDPARYAFCQRPDEQLPPGATALGMFREAEGVTLILEAGTADRLGFTADFLARRLVLTVHSDLAAVGFMARISTALAVAGIPANVVAGVCHDHLFVPERDGDRALAILRRLQSTAASGRTAEVLYSVTVRVDPSIAEEWLGWMRAVHVPEVVSAGGFLGCSISRELEPSAPGNRIAFVLDYRAPSLSALHAYQTTKAPALQNEHSTRFAGRFDASRSVRIVLGDAAAAAASA